MFLCFTVVLLNILLVSSLYSLSKRVQFAYVTITGIVFSETYWIPNSFSNASNHSKFSIAATANVQVNYEQQIFDKEKSSDLGWQASILAKVILIILPITKITQSESWYPTALNALQFEKHA